MALMPCGNTVLGAHCGPIGQWTLEGKGSIASVYAGSGAVLTRDENMIPGGLWLQPRYDPQDSRAALQRWTWDSAARQLRSEADGSCLAATPLPEHYTNVWGRALSTGAWALVFVNADTSAQKLSVACPWAGCLDKTSFSATTRLRVRDLVRHAELANITAKDGYAASVEGAGGSETLLLTPADPGVD